MRKLVLVIGSLAAVVLLALLVRVADQGDRVTYTGSYEQLAHGPHGGHLRGHRSCDGRGHLAGHLPRHMPGRSCARVAELRTVGCHRDDGGITLTYSYGADDRVAPFMEPRGRGLVVGVEVVSPPLGTIVPSIAMLGTATFATFGEPAWIRDPAGKDVPCPRGKAPVSQAP